MLGYLSPSSLRTPNHVQGIFVTLLLQAIQSIDSSDAIMPDNLQDDNIEGRCLHMYTGMCEQPNFKVRSMPTQQQRISNPVALTRVIL